MRRIYRKTIALLLVLSTFFGVIESEASGRNGSAISIIYTDGNEHAAPVPEGLDARTMEMISYLLENVYDRTETEKALIRKYLMLCCGWKEPHGTVWVNGEKCIKIESSLDPQRGMKTTRRLSTACLMVLMKGGYAIKADAPALAADAIKEVTDAYDLAVKTKAEALGMSEREKVMYAFENVRKGYTIDLSTEQLNRASFKYITRRTGCCETINGAFFLMLRASGLDADICVDAGVTHTWCTVNIDGVRYHVDATGYLKNFLTDGELPEGYRTFLF